MTCTSHTGAATSSGSLAYATYVMKATLEAEHTYAAKYYAGDLKQGRDRPEPAVNLKQDLSPAFARKLGIDQSRALSLNEIAHLMNNRTADNSEIEGRKKHSPHQSVASVFGLDAKTLPTVDEIKNVLAGKRVDGTAPVAEPELKPDSQAPDDNRAMENLAHAEAWLNGQVAPNLDRLAEHAASSDAIVSSLDVERRLVSEIELALDRAERQAQGVAEMSAEARALHGLPVPEPVAEHLQGLSIEDLQTRREQIVDQWDAVSSVAEYNADCIASGPSEPEAVPLSDKRIESAVRAFKAAIGVGADRDATDEEIQQLADGQIDVADYRKQINATAPPVGYVDLTFSADKSVSVSYALAPTEAERAFILSAVNGATDDAMTYAQTVLGVARRGAGGKGEEQCAELVDLGFQHYTSRPATDIVRLDAQGQEYSAPHAIPGGASDVNLHQHRIVLSSVMTKDGHIGSIDLSRLKGEQKVFGAVFHAGLATRLREGGADVTLGPSGEARIVGVPDWVRKFNSRRSTQGEEAAQEWAKEQGKDWRKLTSDEKVAAIKEGVAKERERKPGADPRRGDEADANIKLWKEENEAAGYRHKSILQPGRRMPKLTQEQRIEIAREVSLSLLDKTFQKRLTISAGEMREIGARGLIVSGLGTDAAADINAVVKTFRERGVMVNGEATKLIELTAIGENGRKQNIVTTEYAFFKEEGLMAAARSAAADRSTALTAAQIDQAADRFLAKHPKIDPQGAQWIAQREMAHRIGEGGRLSLSIGVAGSGKTSSVVATLVDAWHQDGRFVYGMTVPWKASVTLRDAGVDKAVAIEAFIKGVERGSYKIDSKTVIVADEVSQIGIRHQTALMKLAAEHGAQLVEIGDYKQCQSVETPAIELLAKAVGDDNIAKLLTTIRQKTDRDREVAGMFRDGKATEGMSALQEDGRFHLAAGGSKVTVQRTTELWRKMTDANTSDPDYSLLVMVPTNAHAREIGLSIRANRREAGEIDQAETVLKAMDPNSKEIFDLPVSVGDKLRMFTRTFDADTPGRKKSLSSNGDVVEVKEILSTGLRIRNEAGDEGRVTWAQMKSWRAPTSDPVQVTLGYAVTIDTAQSLTRSAAILSMPGGSGQVSGHKAYTGASRHEGELHIIVDDASERRAIVNRQMRGLNETPTRAEVIRNIAANMSRFETKPQAIDTLRRAISVQRGSLGDVRMASVAADRYKRDTGQVPTPSLSERMHLRAVVDRMAEAAHQVRQQMQIRQQQDYVHRQSQSHGPSMGR